MTMNYLIVPDLHGEWDRVEKALSELKNIHATWIFLGDYIDRGKNNLQVIENLIKLKNEKPETIFLKGNHEEFLLGSLDKNYLDKNSVLKNENSDDIKLIWFRNGGEKTLSEYKTNLLEMNISQEHIEFFKSLSLYHIDKNCIFVHAGLNKNKKFNENTSEDFLWIRPPFGLKYNMNTTVIYGHTPYSNVNFDINENSIGLDTGNYRNTGKLSILHIKVTGEIIDIFEYK